MEQKFFEQNRENKKERAKEKTRQMAIEASRGAGTEVQTQGRRLADIGIATPLLDWKRLLSSAMQDDEEWTRKNARMRGEFFGHRIQDVHIPETEILLDVSGSVSETLLRNFLKECKNIVGESKVKVGCFNGYFLGFQELRRPSDIDKLDLPIGGGTNFDRAVEAFSKRADNKIIFTDGYARMPQKVVRGVIWVVYGTDRIEPKGGKVIMVSEEDYKKLSQGKGSHNMERW